MASWWITATVKVIKTVKIGDQWWMAQNLNFKMANTWCGGGSDTSEGDCSKYGRLYNWSAAMDSAGIWTSSGKDFGFSALPIGFGEKIQVDGLEEPFIIYLDEEECTGFWNSTQEDLEYAYHMKLSVNDNLVFKGAVMHIAFSVRCLKD